MDKLKMSRVASEPLTISRIFLCFICPAACVTSLHLTLVPNQLFSGWSGMFLFLTMGIAATAYHLGQLEVKPTDEESSGLVAFRFLALSALYGFVAWAIVGKCLPWVSAETLGTPYTRDVRVQMKYSDSVRGCDGVLKTPLMEGTYPNFICADGKNFPVFSGLMVDVRLSGKETFLGATVDKVEWVRLVFDEPRQRDG